MQITYTVRLVPASDTHPERYEVTRAVGSGVAKPLGIGRSQRPRRFPTGAAAKDAAIIGARADLAASDRFGWPARFVEGPQTVTVYVEN